MQPYYLQDIAAEKERIAIRHGLPGLSALVISRDSQGGDQLTEARHESLRALMLLVAHSGRATWLAAGHAYPQPKTRITDYYRLWGNLARSGITFLQADGKHDIRTSSADGIRYFGYRKVGLNDIASTDDVLRRMQSFIIVARDESEVIEMVDGGWSSVGGGVPPEAFQRSLEYNVPVILVMGEFDDSTAEGVLVAPPETLNDFRGLSS